MKTPTSRPYVSSYFVATSAGIPCRVDTSFHHLGVLVPAKAGERPEFEPRFEDKLHPERVPLQRLRRLIWRSYEVQNRCRLSLHRDHPLFSVFIHAGPYKLMRRWTLPDGTAKDMPYPFSAVRPLSRHECSNRNTPELPGYTDPQRTDPSGGGAARPGRSGRAPRRRNPPGA